MKDIHFAERRPVMRIPMHDAPPLQGWAVRLLQDIPEGKFKIGYWMDHWTLGPERVDFGFERELYMAFNLEAEANKVRDALLANELKTEVVKIGNPQ